MISSSLRTANAIAFARQKLLSRPSMCHSEQTRLLQKYWTGGGAQIAAQAFTTYPGAKLECHIYHGFNSKQDLSSRRRSLSTTSSLHIRAPPKSKLKEARKIAEQKAKKQIHDPPSSNPSKPSREPASKPNASVKDKVPRKSEAEAEAEADEDDFKPRRLITMPSPKTHRRILGVFVFLMSAYLSTLYISYRQEVTRSSTISTPSDVSSRYNEIANTFDSDIDRMEYFLFIIGLRRKLCSKAKGDVCEVSIGTGRNLQFYDWSLRVKKRETGYKEAGQKGYAFEMTGDVKSFTAVDKSAEMLEVAHEKFGKLYPGIVGIRWVLQDASDPLPPPPASADERSGHKIGKKYDTIIQTFGLCSTPDPVKLLRNLGESVEADGRILLLEHGKGKYEWINKILDNLAPGHAERYGCWWNKDIGEIVKESGLEVVEVKRKHFGTTWWFELKPKAKQEKVVEKSEGKAEKKEVHKVEEKKGKKWW